MEKSDILQIALLVIILVYVLKIAKNNKSPVGPKSKINKLIMDTSALIDGRILEIANAGFAPSQIIVPRFVINELQLLADGKDAHKRERARFGLDMVKDLQNSSQCDVVVLHDSVDDTLPTDDKLIVLAKKLSADLCTTDYNLNKVATIEGIRVLNVNELANAMRPIALPGEIKRVKIIQKGSNRDQGVGYLDDGSMVVVEGAARSISKTIEAEIVRYIQTDAGKMLFARKLVTSNEGLKARKKIHSQTTR